MRNGLMCGGGVQRRKRDCEGNSGYVRPSLSLIWEGVQPTGRSCLVRLLGESNGESNGGGSTRPHPRTREKQEKKSGLGDIEADIASGQRRQEIPREQKPTLKRAQENRGEISHYAKERVKSPLQKTSARAKAR